MVEASEPTYVHAIEWASRGWAVFPVCSPLDVGHEHRGKLCEGKNPGKMPLTADGFKSATLKPNVIEAKFRHEFPIANIAATPPEGLVVLDEDDPLTRLDLPETLTFQTSRGFHYVYKDTRNCVPQTQPGSQLAQGYDTRVHGKGYIVLPPSKHVSGFTYAVYRDIEPVEFPYHLFSEDVFKQSTPKSKAVNKVAKGSLEALLGQPLDDPECGDGWLLSVAGHLATFCPSKSIYESLLERISGSMAQPFSPAALSKKGWTWEQEQLKRLNAASNQPGWLIEWPQAGYGTEIGSGDSLEIVPFSNFKIKAKHVTIYDDRQVWLVDFVRDDGSILEDQELPADVLASTTLLRKYLMNRGMSLYLHKKENRGSPGERLLDLMKSQNPKTYKAVDYFGWSFDEVGFVTPTHVIKADGIEERRTVFTVKDDDIRFGLCEPELAKEALETFLSFQKPEVTYVLGAWLMSVLLKEHYKYRSPSLVIEGIAGSAKTEMSRTACQLIGADRKGGRMTYPVARDQYALSPNTVVWLDDAELDERTQELIRQACTSGDIKLKNINTHETRTVKLLASTLISHEGLNWTNQKAIRDRFYTLDFPRLPEGEEGRKSGERWYAFKQRFGGDLCSVAGTLVQLVLQNAGLTDTIADLCLDNTRMGQGIGVMRMGARVLSAILGDDKYTRVVDEVLVGSIVDDQSSVIVRDVIPYVWRAHGYPECAGENGLFIPVFRDSVTGRFWVNMEKLHDAWNANHKGQGQRDKGQTTIANIKKQLAAVGASESVPKRSTGDRKCLRYREIPDRYSDIIFEASGIHQN